MGLFQNIKTNIQLNSMRKEVKVLQKEMEYAKLSAQLEVVKAMNYGYSNNGASKSKNSLKGWIARSGSPQQDIDLNLETLRQRSRDAYMGSPIATAAIKSNRTNCVGEGLRLKSRIDYKALGITQEESQKLKEHIEREWQLWSESTFCDNKGQHNFRELQQIAFIAWLLNGDCFALPFYAKSTEWYMPYQLRIRLVESDKVSSPGQVGDYIDLNKRNKKTGNRIINGIEIDDEGKVVAYWFCNGYKTETTQKEWIRVEAFGKNTGNPNVLHVFEAERCEQYRGVPFLSPILETLKQLTRYQEAEIMAAVIGGLFTIFITTEDGNPNVDFGGVEDQDSDTDEDDEHQYELGNGIINYLAPGEKIEQADPKRPNSNFDPFVKAFCKYIGAALEIPVEILLMEFTASYSASRGALLQAWQAFRMRRSWFAKAFCQPVYELWFAEAVSKGRINAPGFFNNPIIRLAYVRSSWTGPAPGQLDPVKEVTASKMRIEEGLSNREREAIEINGSDFDENADQLLLEEEKMKEIRRVSNDET